MTEKEAGRDDGHAGRSRRIVVAEDLGELWLSLIEDNRPLELSIRPAAASRWLGNIVKGRITRLAPGVRAAFVDIGLARDAFTVMPPGTIAERHLVPGDEVLVQVTREAHGGKGHRATFEVTLPGWALVLAPGSAHRGVSKRIPDDDERDRLREILAEITPDGYGLIARTAATGLTREELVADRDALVARWEEIARLAAASRAPAVLHHEEDPAVGFVRDHLAGGLDEVVVAGRRRGALEEALSGLGSPLRLRVHDGPLPAIEAYALEHALAEALAPEVLLRGGGRLVIQSTEALVAIDVNSGTDTGASDLEETALRTNLEAAAEVARQVRLRDLAGLIVIDFIDVESGASRAAINEAVVAAFERDRVKSRTLPLSDFCLAQITRQRKRLPLERGLLEPCPCCGRGARPRAETVARALLRELRRRLRPYPSRRARVSAPAATLAAAREIFDTWGAEDGLPEAGRISWAEGEAGIEVL